MALMQTLRYHTAFDDLLLDVRSDVGACVESVSRSLSPKSCSIPSRCAESCPEYLRTFGYKYDPSSIGIPSWLQQSVNLPSNFFQTALHCYITREGEFALLLESLSVLFHAWPVATLLAGDSAYRYYNDSGDTEFRPMIPCELLIHVANGNLDGFVGFGSYLPGEDPTVEFVEAMHSYTKDAAIALLDCIFMRQSKVEDKVRASVRRIVPLTNNDDGDTVNESFSSVPLSSVLRTNLTVDMIREILALDGVQSLLQRNDYREMICGIVNMFANGRREAILEEPGDKELAVRILARVSDNQNCQFVFLCENPMLLHRPSCFILS